MTESPFCTWCSSPLRSARQTKYCSQQCSQFAARARTARNYRDKREAEVRLCLQCGERIVNRSRKALYCSDLCLGRSGNAKTRSAKAAEWQAREFVCEYCREQFFPEYKRSANQARRFCSDRCRKLSNVGRNHQHVKSRYGLSIPAYERVLSEQENSCAICRTELTGRGGHVSDAPHIDHDHRTGRNRGILCRNCNLALGLFGDDIARLRSATRYLESWA